MNNNDFIFFVDVESSCAICYLQCLKSSLSTQPSEGLLSDTKRVLLHEGLLTLMGQYAFSIPSSNSENNRISAFMLRF